MSMFIDTADRNDFYGAREDYLADLNQIRRETRFEQTRTGRSDVPVNDRDFAPLAPGETADVPF